MYKWLGLPSDVTFEEIKHHFSKVGLIALSPYDQLPKIKIYRISNSSSDSGDIQRGEETVTVVENDNSGVSAEMWPCKGMYKISKL